MYRIITIVCDEFGDPSDLVTLIVPEVLLQEYEFDEAEYIGCLDEDYVLCKIEELEENKDSEDNKVIPLRPHPIQE